MKMTVGERLERRLGRDEQTGCWPYLRFKDANGYGRIWIGDKVVGAHRLAYELFCGDIPDGMVVCHRCDNPGCCNPAHLFVGTQGDNNRDRARKGRSAKVASSHFKRSALTFEVAEDIRAGKYPGSQTQIADALGVSQSTISMVMLGRAHIRPENSL